MSQWKEVNTNFPFGKWNFSYWKIEAAMAVFPRGAGMNKQTENANPRQDFGRRLRKLRQDKGWTLAELAERSGLVI